MICHLPLTFDINKSPIGVLQHDLAKLLVANCPFKNKLIGLEFDILNFSILHHTLMINENGFPGHMKLEVFVLIHLQL